MTDCSPERCTQINVPQIQRTHSASRCPSAPPRTCGECGQVKPDVPAMLAVGCDA